MTFEQWWEENYDARLVTIPVEDPNDDALKAFAAKVWNAALDAARPVVFSKMANSLWPPGAEGRRIIDTAIECVDALKVKP